MLRNLMLAAVLATTPTVSALALGPAAGANAPQQAEGKKICRRATATGSIMPKSVCRTQAEWEQMEAQSRSDLDRTREMERSRSLVEGSRGS